MSPRLILTRPLTRPSEPPTPHTRLTANASPGVSMMRLIVCGGRDYADQECLFRHLDAFHKAEGVSCVISGAARGADTLGELWAAARNVPVARFPANWDLHGKSAGPIRNTQMLAEGRAEAVYAFPGGAGTANMVAQAKAQGVPVWTVQGREPEGSLFG